MLVNNSLEVILTVFVISDAHLYLVYLWYNFFHGHPSQERKILYLHPIGKFNCVITHSISFVYINRWLGNTYDLSVQHQF